MVLGEEYKQLGAVAQSSGSGSGGLFDCFCARASVYTNTVYTPIPHPAPCTHFTPHHAHTSLHTMHILHPEPCTHFTPHHAHTSLHTMHILHSAPCTYFTQHHAHTSLSTMHILHSTPCTYFTPHHAHTSLSTMHCACIASIPASHSRGSLAGTFIYVRT